MRLYISGSMTAEQDHGFERFDKARDHLKILGYDVESPPDIWRELCDKGPTDEWEPGLCTREQIMGLDIEAVQRSHGIALLSTWFVSPGARLEVELGLTLGKPIAPVTFWVLWSGSLTS